MGVFSFFLSDKVNRNIVQAVRPVAGCGQSPNHCESKRMFTTDDPEEGMRQQTQRAVEWKNLHPNSIGPISFSVSFLFSSRLKKIAWCCCSYCCMKTMKRWRFKLSFSEDMYLYLLLDNFCMLPMISLQIC